MNLVTRQVRLSVRVSRTDRKLAPLDEAWIPLTLSEPPHGNDHGLPLGSQELSIAFLLGVAMSFS